MTRKPTIPMRRLYTSMAGHLSYTLVCACVALALLSGWTGAGPAGSVADAQMRRLRPAMAAGQDGLPRAPDYADPADWACRPGREDGCTSRLDAVVLARDGSKRPQPFSPAANPPIDCFYVYPTASREQQPYANIYPGPAIMNVVRAQAGRLASRCRLYAPLYRQATLSSLAGNRGDHPEIPYQDVLAAWNDYIAHDNGGRGVVLIGHSQGTILLQRLIAEQIDGTPAQAQLVSAFLIGNPGLLVPAGKTVGGTFRHVPVCTAAAQTGCAYAWASYLAGDQSTPRTFGADKNGLVAACTNPANPGGGDGAEGLLDAYFAQDQFPPAGSSPYAEVTGQITAACRRDKDGAVLRISVPQGPNAAAIRATLDSGAIRGRARNWGLHRRDMPLAQGSILRLIDAQTASWTRARR